MFKIALLPGDGIGVEVTNSAVQVIKSIAELFNLEFQFKECLIGGCSYDAFGTPLTDETIQCCYESDAVVLGAVGGYKWESLPQNLKPEAALLKLRKSLGLYTNIRPAKIYKPLIDSSSLKKDVLSNVDFVVLRELTSGIYFGEPRGLNTEHGFNTMIYHRDEVIRIAKQAFKIARERNNKVTSVDKANVLEVSQFWRNIVHEVHQEFKDVALNDLYVDNAAMQIVHNPKQFDVILTSNLFGDILSDIAAMITGSLGMLPSASLGDKYALYEPVHGSAPDIAGQNKANPLAAISSVGMMFSYSFKMKNVGDLIDAAIEKTLDDGYRTADIISDGGMLVSTNKMTELVINNLKDIYKK